MNLYDHTEPQIKVWGQIFVYFHLCPIQAKVYKNMSAHFILGILNFKKDILKNSMNKMLFCLPIMKTLAPSLVKIQGRIDKNHNFSSKN